MPILYYFLIFCCFQDISGHPSSAVVCTPQPITLCWLRGQNSIKCRDQLLLYIAFSVSPLLSVCESYKESYTQQSERTQRWCRAVGIFICAFVSNHSENNALFLWFIALFTVTLLPHFLAFSAVSNAAGLSLPLSYVSGQLWICIYKPCTFYL